MRKNTFLGAAALGIAGIFLAGGVANAGVHSWLKVADQYGNDSVRAGDTVTLEGACLDAKVPSVRIQSPVLGPIDVRLKVDSYGNPDTFKVATQVKKDAKPGNYKVSFNCDGQTIVAGLGVVSRDEGVRNQPAKATATKPATSAAKPAQVAEKPKGAAETGEGDVVAQASDSGAPGAGVYALGGAALLATGGVGAFAFRRLRKQG